MKLGKFMLILGLLLLVAPGLMGAGGKGNVNDFLNYLAAHKETLQYVGYEKIEQEKDIVVKIVCNKATQEQLLSIMENYDTSRYYFEMNSPDSIVFYALFKKNLGSVPQEGTAMAKCPSRVKVMAETVKGDVFQEYAYYEEKVALAHETQVSALQSGVVAQLKVAVDEEVGKGKILVGFESASLKKEIKAAEAEVETWKLTLAKRRVWKVRDPKAEKAAENKLNKALTLLDSKKTELDNLGVASPVDGRVTALMVEKGAKVASGTLVAVVMDASLLKITLTPEKTLGLMGGETIAIRFKEVAGEYKGLAKKEQDGVNIYIANEGNQISGGMIAQFRLLAQEYQNAVVLKKEKLLNDEKGTFVYVVEKNRAKKAYLNLGPEEDNRVLIQSGLSIGSTLITSDPTCLSDGKKIKLVTAEALKKEEVKPVVKEEKPVVKEEKPVLKEEKPAEEKKAPLMLKDRFRIGLTAARFEMNHDVNLGTYYPKLIKNTFGFDLGIHTVYNVDFWFAYKIFKSETTTTFNQVPLEFKVVPVSVGARYRFMKWKYLEPFVGAGVNLYFYKEHSTAENPPAPFDEPTTGSAMGFHIQGGTYIDIYKFLLGQIFIKYNLVKDTISETTSSLVTELNMNGLEYGIGLVIHF